MLFIYCFVNCNYMLIVYVVLSMPLKSHTIRCCHDVFGDPKQINHRRRGSCYCRKDVRSHDPRCFDSDKCKVLQLETSSNIDPLVAGQSGQRCYLLSSLISLILRDN
jgi:hypothetical protein